MYNVSRVHHPVHFWSYTFLDRRIIHKSVPRTQRLQTKLMRCVCVRSRDGLTDADAVASHVVTDVCLFLVPVRCVCVCVRCACVCVRVCCVLATLGHELFVWLSTHDDDALGIMCVCVRLHMFILYKTFARFAARRRGTQNRAGWRKASTHTHTRRRQNV